MSHLVLSTTDAMLREKDPGVALTTLGVTEPSKGDSMPNFSTSVDYATYIKSTDWKMKKNQWVASGRPLMCWACEEPMPRNRSGFNFHHKTYANLGNEHLNDLVLLCMEHHQVLEKEFKTNKKMAGISLESWTWIFVSMMRTAYGLPAINKSKIAKYMGEYNE